MLDKTLKNVYIYLSKLFGRKMLFRNDNLFVSCIWKSE